jgi:class 3 adenylate cyclase
MGYTGKTPKYRRTVAVQIEEAYKVVKVGLEMIEIIREVRESSTDPNLRSLDMRIGIHTGKIVGGIIGTKVVRYDIFGQDVLIANKMESNGQQGCVCVSDATLALLK